MEATRLVIIGAGVAGLTAGVLRGAGAGYRTTILEMGAGAGWALHFVAPQGLPVRRQRRRPRRHLAGGADLPPLAGHRRRSTAARCTTRTTSARSSGRTAELVTVFTDIDRLEAHLLENFPVDAVAGRASSRGRSAPACGSTSRSAPRRAWRGLMTSARTAPRRRCAACRRCSSTGASRSAGSAAGCGPLLPAGLRQPRPLRRAGRRRCSLSCCPSPTPHRRMTGIPRDGWLAFARAVERRFSSSAARCATAPGSSDCTTPRGAVRGVELAGGEVVAAEPRPVGRRRTVHAHASCSERRTMRASTRSRVSTSRSR